MVIACLESWWVLVRLPGRAMIRQQDTTQLQAPPLSEFLAATAVALVVAAIVLVVVVLPAKVRDRSARDGKNARIEQSGRCFRPAGRSRRCRGDTAGPAAVPHRRCASRHGGVHPARCSRSETIRANSCSTPARESKSNTT